ncbi:hypothetical protein BMR03_14730 [Methylococcaceae bacterium HT2]|nr:hypothetical protein BMR03_14730 [Methylococcaceae bacterium HT2]
MLKKVQKRPRAKGLLNKHPFVLGKYYLFNIFIYALLSIAVLSWNHLFEEISFWWILCLIPLFLNRFRYIAGGSIVLAVIVLINNTLGIPAINTPGNLYRAFICCLYSY